MISSWVVFQPRGRPKGDIWRLHWGRSTKTRKIMAQLVRADPRVRKQSCKCPWKWSGGHRASWHSATFQQMICRSEYDPALGTGAHSLRKFYLAGVFQNVPVQFLNISRTRKKKKRHVCINRTILPPGEEGNSFNSISKEWRHQQVNSKVITTIETELFMKIIHSPQKSYDCFSSLFLKKIWFQIL